MRHSLRISVKSLFLIMITISILLIATIANDVPLLFAVVLLIWMAMFVFSAANLKEYPVMFCFNIAFFVFLLGRQVCYHYLHLDQVYSFLDVTNNYTYFLIILSFLGLLIGLFLSSRYRQQSWSIKRSSSFLDRGGYENNYRLSCKIVFYIGYICTIVSTMLQILFVQRVGYLASYTVEAGGAGIPTLVGALSRLTPVALSLFLATMPEKKQAIVPLALYEIYGVLSLFTGQRYPFIGVSMYVLIYYLIRSRYERGWIRRYHYVLLIIAIPALMLFMTAYDAIRLENTFNLEGFVGTLEDFFIQQGGSINVIRRSIFNADQLADMHLVSFNGIHSAIFENPIATRIFDVHTYSGNSVERAMNTNSLAHRLSYIAYGNGYLMGRGTGSSYIAELFHDFGAFGVFLGSIIYGAILGKINGIEFNNKLADGIKLSMLYYLLFAPRGTFDTFISSVFNLYTIFGFAIIIILSNAFRAARYGSGGNSTTMKSKDYVLRRTNG